MTRFTALCLVNTHYQCSTASIKQGSCLLDGTLCWDPGGSSLIISLNLLVDVRLDYQFLGQIFANNFFFLFLLFVLFCFCFLSLKRGGAQSLGLYSERNTSTGDNLCYQLHTKGLRFHNEQDNTIIKIDYLLSP